MDAKKTRERLISGVQCSPDSALDEMQAVKKLFRKTDGREYVHIVQSFSPDDDISDELVHELGVCLAGYFEGFQAVVTTHINTGHKHNHIVLNSTSFENGRKFHQSAHELEQVKVFSNELCMRHGLHITPPQKKQKRSPEERERIQAAIEKRRALLTKAIRHALEFSPNMRSFCVNMKQLGYTVHSSQRRKYITYEDSTGFKMRDNKLGDEQLLKENMEALFEQRAAQGFTPKRGDVEKTMAVIDPSFFGEVMNLASHLSDAIDNDAAWVTTPGHQDSRQSRREREKKQALGMKEEYDDGPVMGW